MSLDRYDMQETCAEACASIVRGIHQMDKVELRLTQG